MNNYTTTLVAQVARNCLIEAIPKTFPNINLMPTIAKEIKSIINSLKSKLCGYDEISMTLLISFPLSYLYNQSMAIMCSQNDTSI
jgi:hypothetical protein